MKRKRWMKMPDQIPAVEAYGRFSHVPTDADRAIEAGTSSATAGALGLRS